MFDSDYEKWEDEYDLLNDFDGNAQYMYSLYDDPIDDTAGFDDNDLDDIPI